MTSTKTFEVLRPVMSLASPRFIEDVRVGLGSHSVPHAVASHDSAPIFDWIMSLVALQGVSDAAAAAFQSTHGSATWADIHAALALPPLCPRLQAYWSFECGYRKASWSCLKPNHIDRCPVPRLPLRKGSLNEAAFALRLFVRDIADGDFVSWIDARLATHDPGPNVPDRAVRLRSALLEPLCQIRGIGPKIWSMILADLLLAADPGRERWTVTGASMIAVDSLVHAWLHRTGLLHRMGVEHAYGPACTAPRGCVAAIERLAAAFDARAINPVFPRFFPRLVQHSIWTLCAADGWNICNGRKIDNRHACTQRVCPCFRDCDRVAIG